jgi:hypothetical protein
MEENVVEENVVGEIMVENLTEKAGEELTTLSSIRQTIHNPHPQDGVVALNGEERFIWPVTHLNYTYYISTDHGVITFHGCLFTSLLSLKFNVRSQIRSHL